MDVHVSTRNALQGIGVSEEDIERYLAIDKKLQDKTLPPQMRIRQPQMFSDNTEASTTSAPPLSFTEQRLREIVELGLQPLRTAVEEIKATVAKELEEERVLLRNHLAAVQHDIMNQLTAIRIGMNQQLEALGLQQQRVHEYYNNETNSHEAGLRLLPQEDKHQVGEHETNASDVGTVSFKSEDKHEHEEHDIHRDLMWFKEQVTLLQEEHRQYRQELRRQEQQQMLQQNVSVSKSELQDELKVTKEEILSTVKALCAYMEVEISDSSKTLHEETKDAMREMLSENKKCVHEEVTGTMSKMLTENQIFERSKAKESQDAECENLAENRDHARPQASETDATMPEGALEKLQALAMGQSQRVIDKIRNPACENRYVFHMYIPHFKDLIGSGKKVYSLPSAMDFQYTFMVVRGVASFSEGNSKMILGLEHIVDAYELGLEQEKASPISIKSRVKAQKSSAMPDIDLAEQNVCWGGDPTAATDKHFVSLGQHVACHRFVNPAYNTFKDNSVIIEFEISLIQEQNSLFALFKR